MEDAMSQLVKKNTSPADNRDYKEGIPESKLLSQFREQVKKASFVRIDRRNPTRRSLKNQLKKADGIIRIKQDGKRECVLFSKTFKGWFPEVGPRKRMVALLRARSIFRRGRRRDTATRQIFITELKRKVPGYVISRSRLRRANVKGNQRD